MSGVTNSLVKEFKKIDDEINNPEYDVVVSTGEQYSSAIISAYLNKKRYTIKVSYGLANTNFYR